MTFIFGQHVKFLRGGQSCEKWRFELFWTRFWGQTIIDEIKWIKNSDSSPSKIGGEMYGLVINQNNGDLLWFFEKSHILGIFSAQKLKKILLNFWFPAKRAEPINSPPYVRPSVRPSVTQRSQNPFIGIFWNLAQSWGFLMRRKWRFRILPEKSRLARFGPF